jgi:hypothetical protein
LNPPISLFAVNRPNNFDSQPTTFIVFSGLDGISFRVQGVLTIPHHTHDVIGSKIPFNGYLPGNSEVLIEETKVGVSRRLLAKAKWPRVETIIKGSLSSKRRHVPSNGLRTAWEGSKRITIVETPAPINGI